MPAKLSHPKIYRENIYGIVPGKRHLSYQKKDFHPPGQEIFFVPLILFW